MGEESNHRNTWSSWKPLAIGIFSVVFLIGAIGVWSVKTDISGAIIGAGKVQVSASRLAVQHPIGGVVAEVLVGNGDTVQAGDVVLRLDASKLTSKLNIIEAELFELLAQEARLQAEIYGSRDLELHPLLNKAAKTQPEIQKLIDRQRRHLTSRYDSVDTKSRLLAEQIKQVDEQIIGTHAQLDSKIQRKYVVEAELVDAEKLAAKGLIKSAVLSALKKDQLNTQGEMGRLVSKVAELKGKIAEFRLKVHALPATMQEEAIVELGKMRPKRNKLLEERLSALDRLSKLEIRTPVGGKIHDSQILGVRSVVSAAKPLMYIVPNDRPISILVRVSAADIDQVYVSQPASLKFSSFSRRRTPEIFGTVSRISADAFLDKVKRKPYYEVEISLTLDEIAKLEGKTLIPGMPVNAFISTEGRSPLNYVTKPLRDYFERAFRDS